MGISVVVAYVGGYLYLVFFAICLATGLYYLAELVEEYTRLSKKMITYAIGIVMTLHVALWLIDGLPTTCILVGLAAHAAYLSMLKTFPFVRLTSIEFLGSVALLICGHVFWFRYFLYDPVNRFVTIEYMLGFMLIMAWMVPFGYFISLAANESVLPGGPGSSVYGGYGGGGYGGGAGVGISSRGESAGGESFGELRTSKRSRGGGSVLGFFKFLMRKRDEVLPSIRSHIPTSYMSGKDRLL